MCRSLSRQLYGSKLFVLGPISLHSLYPTYRSRRLAKYPSLFTFTSRKTLSHGFSRPRIQVHLVRRQRTTRFSCLSGFRLSLYRRSVKTVSKRSVRFGTQEHSTRTRFRNHRLVPLPISPGLPLARLRQQSRYILFSICAEPFLPLSA